MPAKKTTKGISRKNASSGRRSGTAVSKKKAASKLRGTKKPPGKIKSKRLSQKEYKALVESISDGVLVLDREWRYVMVNKALKRMIGKTEEELIGNRIKDVFPGFEKSSFFKTFKRVLKIGKPEIVSDSFTFEDGRIGWYEVRAYPFPEGLFVIVSDIAEQKKMEAAVKESERRFRLLSEVAFDGIALTEQGTFLDVNAEFSKMFGYAPSEIIGNHVSKLIAPEYVENDVQKILSGYDRPFDTEGIKKDGTRFQFEVSSRSFQYGDRTVRITAIRDITERKQVEKKINEMAKFPSENPYPVMRIARNGTILYANPVSHTLLKTWRCSVGGPLPASYEDIIGDVLKDGARINVEVKQDSRVLSLSFVPIREFGYVNVYGFDITNRKQAEKALLENQHFVQRIADTAPNILYIIDVQRREFIYANHMLEIQLGYSLEDLRNIEKGMEKELVHPDDLPKWSAHLNYISRIHEGDVASVTFRVRSVQGEWRWLYNRNIVFRRTRDGTVSQVLGAALDITDRKQIEDELDRYRQTLEKMVASRTANLIETNEELEKEISSRKLVEKSLRASEDEFRKLSQEFHNLLDALPDSIMQLSPDLTVMWANSATGNMIGFTASEAKDLHCYELWHGRPAACEECPAIRSFGTGRSETAFVTNRNGKSFDIKAIPIKDDNERVHSVMLVTSDVTERNRLQAEALRAAHLASIGELSAGVAHEINNPINGIINYAQILIDRNRKRKEKDLVEDDLARQIIHEGDRISNIVSSLLSFSRDSTADEKALVNINDVLSDALALTDALLRKDGIRLNVRMPSDIPPVIGHYQQIEQVFLNIINNARYALNEKYAGNHKNKLLEITGEQLRLHDSPGVRVTFTDFGIGIPADHLDKVIHPFFTSKPGGKGTGLGLSISHGIVTEHNGRLFFESEEGKYTSVMVDIPERTTKDHEEKEFSRLVK